MAAGSKPGSKQPSRPPHQPHRLRRSRFDHLQAQGTTPDRPPQSNPASVPAPAAIKPLPVASASYGAAVGAVSSSEPSHLASPAGSTRSRPSLRVTPRRSGGSADKAEKHRTSGKAMKVKANRVSDRFGTGGAPSEEGAPSGPPSLIDQFREALVANLARIIDLFRGLDENGDGMVSKKEFRHALPLLGLTQITDEVSSSRTPPPPPSHSPLSSLTTHHSHHSLFRLPIYSLTP